MMSTWGENAVTAMPLTTLGLALAMGLTACANTGSSLYIDADNTSAAVAETANFERDRQSILAMAGDYKVTFDFRETVPLKAGYQPKDAYITHAEEIVRVIEDRGDFISLQHILLVGGPTKKMPIKHWRQDWVYEPTEMTRFIGGNVWQNIDLAPADVDGKWAQFVYQVDDGPRYTGLGEWRYDSGFAEWASAPSWRPLPRRDATKRSDYHTIEAVNRHALTPNGWVHEQDNTKLILSADGPQALVREVGVNTYVHAEGLAADVAMGYWTKTKAFWEAVRAEWSALEKQDQFGLTVQGEPEEIYMQILGVAESLIDGETTTEQAANDAREIIAAYTVTEVAPLTARIAAAPKFGETYNSSGE